MKTCNIGGCERKHIANGLCEFHRDRKRRGKPLEGPPQRRPDGIILFEKQCTMCGWIFPNTKEYFHTSKNSYDGLTSQCKHCRSKLATSRNRRVRREVLSHYSDGIPHCVCCGETEFEFLTIDHINGGGNAHRKSTGSGANMTDWIRRNNYPDGFQILCMNCNWAKGMYGECPHTKR